MLFYALGQIKFVIKVNFTCVFFIFLNAATGNFKTSHVDGSISTGYCWSGETPRSHLQTSALEGSVRILITVAASSGPIVQVTLFSWKASGIFLAALFTTTVCSKNIISFKPKHFLKCPAGKHFFFFFPSCSSHRVLSKSPAKGHAHIFLWAGGYRTSFSLFMPHCLWLEFFGGISSCPFQITLHFLISLAQIFLPQQSLLKLNLLLFCEIMCKPNRWQSFLLMTFAFSFDHFPNGWDYGSWNGCLYC